jgi:FkbM family methyltransferase
MGNAEAAEIHADAALVMLGRREEGHAASTPGRFRRAWVALWEALAIGRLVAPLGADPRARVSLFLTTVSLRARSGLGLSAGRPRRLRLAKFGERFSMVVADYGDIAAMRDVLLSDEYAVATAREPEVIVDLGAHVGSSVAYFRLRYPHARIFAVEPDPETLERLRVNVSQFDKVAVRQAAVAGADGNLTLYRDNESTASSLKRGDRGLDGVIVEALTIQSLLDELGVDRIDLLKLDIEGAELEALRGFDGLDRVEAVVGEVHPELIDGSSEEFFALLDGFEVERDWPSPQSCTFTAVRRGQAPPPSASAGA